MALRKRHIGLFLKLLIAVVACWFIVRKLRLKQEDLDLFSAFTDLTTGDKLPYFILLILMMLANWLLETAKWRLLISKVEHLSMIKSFKAILSGITVALFTPNRVGEYGGRVFHLMKGDRISAVLLTVVGSYAQLLVTIIAGLIGAIFYLPDNIGTGPLNTWGVIGLAVIVLAFCVFLVIMFLNTAVLSTILRRLPFGQKHSKYIDVFEQHDAKTLATVLAASFGRYFIFTAQFILLLHLFDVEIGYFTALMLISLTYLTMTVVPTIAITELPARGSLAIFFLGSVSSNSIGIFTASSMLWVINLVIPALLGVIFIFDLTFFRNNE